MLATTLVLSLLTTCASDDAPVVKLTLVPTGMSKQIGYYAPIRTQLSETKPDTIKKLPDGLTAPLFTAFNVAGREGAIYHAVIDEPADQPFRMWIDTNGDGDLTNDDDIEWKGNPRKEEDGRTFTMYSGSGTLNLGTESKPHEIGINLYRFDKTDERRAASKDSLLYYRDYATAGEIKLGDNIFKIILADDNATGDFRGKDVTDDERSASGIKLLIDRNADGAFARRGEQYDARKPFNIGGTTYELADISKDGLTFAVRKSDKKVDEVALAPDHKVGKSITTFEAKTMDGKDIKFPGDYKGKIVLLDFWATWCGPCIMEMPHVVAAYEKFHKQGFDVLGISLDRPDAEKKIAKSTGDLKMSWPQVYDGGYWKARIAQMYAIDSIPATFLVDGDTGKIIGANLRGEALAKAVEDALEKKKTR